MKKTDSNPSRDLQRPQVLIENAQRKQGLILLSGLKGEGVEETVLALKGSAPKAVTVMDGKNTLDEVLERSEGGELVFWVIHAPTPLFALRRVLSKSYGEGRRHLLWRFAEQLIVASGQVRLPSLGSEDNVDAYEILLMTPVLRQALAEEDMEVFDASLRKTEEGLGILSLNQSLLQLLLRRNIDIKAAFEATRDPVHLDQILKKVGI